MGALPVGAIFLACSADDVGADHGVKAYAQAAPGAPSLSVPHLDRRRVDGKDHLLFGPYASFTTRLLKGDRPLGALRAVDRSNAVPLVQALAKGRSLVGFLLRQLLEPRSRRMQALRRLAPEAAAGEWRAIKAGVRAQLVTDGEEGPEIRLAGTEVVVSDDRSIGALLGASPGASTAVHAMVQVLRRAFPDAWEEAWVERLADAIPGLERHEWDEDAVAAVLAGTDSILGLAPREPAGADVGRA